MHGIPVLLALLLLTFLGSCRKEETESPASAAAAIDSRRPAAPMRQPADSVDQLIESRVPRGVGGQPGWMYQQRASADLDVDGTAESIVLISDVGVDDRGQPMWEHGHRWQVYVEEADGARTYLYARFLPNGKLTAELTQPESAKAPTVTLLEQSPTNIALYEIAYNGAGKAEIATQLVRNIRPGTFSGSPRP